MNEVRGGGQISSKIQNCTRVFIFVWDRKKGEVCVCGGGGGGNPCISRYTGVPAFRLGSVADGGS